MTKINRSVLKALEVIEILSQARDGLSLSKLAERTGYPASTTHRLLATLAERGYVEQDPRTRRYFLGIKILTFQAQAIRRGRLVCLAFPHLNCLKQQLNANVNLGVLSGKDVVYLETFIPDSPLAFYISPGLRMPAYCTAMGKVLLTHLASELQESLFYSLEMEPITPYTITSLTDLRAELAEVAQRGYAVDDQEYAMGIRCIAAPIRDHGSTVIAAASVTFLAEHLPDERIEPAAVLMTEACLNVSRALDYQADT